MKRIWKAIFRPFKNFRYQQRAIKHAEKIALGQVTDAAPIHRGAKTYYDEIQNDEKIRKELLTKDDNLVNNMNKFNVNTNEVVESYPTGRPLPTKESEWQHRNDAEWEYGYFEPPLEKIPKGKLLFREALEILHLRQEFDDPRTAQNRAEEIKEKLNKHPATKRVSEEHLDRIWEYFRPFERHDTQDVVSISELEQLHELLTNSKKEIDILDDIESGMGKLLQSGQSVKDKYVQLEEAEKRQFLKETMIVRHKEAKRLTEKLKQIQLPEIGGQNENNEMPTGKLKCQSTDEKPYENRKEKKGTAR